MLTITFSYLMCGFLNCAAPLYTIIMSIIQKRYSGQLKELVVILRCEAARHGLGIHILNNEMLWQVFQESYKLRKEKKEGKKSKEN